MQFPPKKKRTLDMYKKIVERFEYLHGIKRKRYDDCISELANEFHKSEHTIEQILKYKDDLKTIN